MQPLARDGYSADEVRRALTAFDQTWDFGVEVLDPSLAVVEDISGDVTECTVSRRCFDTVHGQIDMLVSRPLRWGRDRVRPYVLLSSDEAAVARVRFDMGVYIPQSPRSVLSEIPVAYRVSGWDQISLLQYYATESWAVAGGDNVLDQVRAVIAAAGVTAPVVLASDKADAVVPSGGKVWPLVRTQSAGGPDDEQSETSYRWITIVNDLLTMVGYVGLYAGPSGTLRSEPATRAIDRPIDWDFDMSSPLRIVSDRTAEWDVWDAYNRWVFYQSGIDGEPVEGVSQVTVDNLDVGPASQLALGVRQAAPQAIDAASYASLVTAARATADAAIAGTRTVSTTCSKMPVLWHRDTCLFSDAAAGANRWRIVGQSWRVALHDDSDQTIDWQVVSDAA